jgi:hypothetical protein
VALAGTRMPPKGSKSAANRAATHSACLCHAGPRRMRRQPSAATAAASGTCHSAFTRKVSRMRLIVSMFFLLGVFQKLLNFR